MKKFGLLSVAAAVALSTSAYAADVNVFGEAAVKGAFERTPGNKEGKKYYNLKAKAGLELKNEDGITLKANWVIYNAPFAAEASNAGSYSENNPDKNETEVKFIAPTLDYAYVTIPSLLGVKGLQLKSGYVESGSFGTTFTATGNSNFRPFDISYKVSDEITVGFKEDMKKETNENAKGGIFPFTASGEDNVTKGDQVMDAVYVKGKVEGVAYGVQYARTTFGKYSKDNNDKVLGMNHIQAFAIADVDMFNVAAHISHKSGDKEAIADSQLGLYAHAIANLDNLTAGLAIAMLKDGYTAGGDFGPTYMTDDDIPFTDIGSEKSKDTTLFIVPVSFSMDALTLEAKGAFGKVIDKSYTEIDLGASYALGKATDISLNYAMATGDAVNKDKKDNKDATLLKWTLSTSF